MYAARAFQRGEIIETCPVIVCRAWEAQGTFRDYWWEWKPRGRYGLPLGYVSMMNHGGRRRRNVLVTRLYGRRVMQLRAARAISVGEELLLDYGMPSYDFVVLD